jgi:hypothetical protein
MTSKRPIMTLCVFSASLLLGGCGGGGSPSAGGSTPTPTPISTPTPAPTSQVVWKVALPPAQSANLLSMITTGSTVFGAGVKANASATGTNTYAASLTDNGTSATAGTPTSLSEMSDIIGMLLLNPTTAFAVGSDIPAGTTAAVPTAFTLNPSTGAFLSVKPFSCAAGTALAPVLANAVDASAVAQDGTILYVALTLRGDVPQIVKTDLAGNLDCTQTAIRVAQGNTNGAIHSVVVTSTALVLGGEFLGAGSVPQGFLIILDKTTGAQTFAVVVGGTPIAGVVVDLTGPIYVGGTQKATEPNNWVIEKFSPPFTAINSAPVWAKFGISPAQNPNGDTLVALLAGPAGGVIAVGQTTPAGHAPNDVQTSIAVLDAATGTTTKAVQVNVFPGDQEHVGSAVVGANNTVFLGGEKFTPNVGNFGAWIAKISLQ